ncbi:30S ribosomal protein S28e [Candidatus Pacearchaeota archaeon]|nr:30S ribosomal protein S28e [Candidatus Pacearchaeota archaeon]
MGSNKPQRTKEVATESIKGQDKSSGRIAVPAIIEELIGRTGFRGEITQVKCKITEGPEAGKSIRRNVKGPIQLNDIIMLRETDIEARKIKSKVNKGAYT